MIYALYEEEKGIPRYVGESTSNLRKKLGVLKYGAKQENNWNSPLVRWINANEIEILLLEDDGQKEWWVEYLKYLGCNLLNNTTGCEEGKEDKTCEICGTGFTKNQVQGGVFTSHIKTKHGMSKRDYVIETKYDGEPPECECGYCGEIPDFYRGDLRKYAAKEHMTHEWQKKKYIEENGVPVCAKPGCQNETLWRRGDPTKFCSHECAGKHNGGFTQTETQEKIKHACKEKYGTENPSELEKVKKKISDAKKGINPWENVSDEKEKEWKQNIGDSVSKRWKDKDYKHSVLNSISESVCDSSAKSKPHKEFCEKLNLKDKGYKSEQQLGGYIVDELNEEKGKVIEVFGDYVHANPEKYDADDIIKLPGSSYKAKEKWEHDRKKIDWLEKQGYEVVILWSSDQISEAREKL